MSEQDSAAAIAHVNGEFVPLRDARVSILDRGFLFGDAVYEVIPVYAGRCYRLAAHLQRLQRSMHAIGLPNPQANARWTALVEDLVARNGGGDLSVYLQVTRGTQPRRDHRLPDAPRPAVVAFCQSRPRPDPALFEHGISAISMPDSRWQYCCIKSTGLLANVLMADQARAQGAAEALLVRDGQILEGASSNVFAIIDGCITTPALRDRILAGITRAAVLELAAAHGIAHAEVQALSVAAVAAADELWITSSTREIYPVTRLDDAPIGAGRPGPAWARMAALLQADTPA